MFDVFATAIGAWLVTKAETDTQKVIGGAILAAALNNAFRKLG